MASQSRQQSDRLAFLKKLMDAPWRFEFFAAARRLETIDDKAAPIALSRRPSQDSVRFAQAPVSGFAPAEIESAVQRDQTLILRLFVSGLLGPHGPMPQHFTEMSLQRLRHHGDSTLVDFLDIFHHRTYSLLYRAWRGGRPEMEIGANSEDRFQLFIGALAGLADRPSSDVFEEYSRRRVIGFLAASPGNIEYLERTLRSIFSIPASVRSFLGEWVFIDPKDKACLGVSGGTLKTSPALGDKAWIRTGAFELALGPMPFKEYEKFFPNLEQSRELKAIVTAFAGLEKSWRLRLICERETVPPLQLKSSGEGKTRLGYSSWLSPSTKSAALDDFVVDAGRL